MNNTQTAPSPNDQERFARGPDWRVQLAGLLPGRLSPREARECEPCLRDYYEYQRLKSQSAAADAAAEAYPAIAAAEQFSRDEELAASLKLMVAGGLATAEIGARLKLEPAALTAWEQLFFDIREMRDSIGWMTAKVIEPERRRGRAALAARLKFALAAGPAGVQQLLEGRGKLPFEEAERLFDRQLRMYLKFDEAIESPLEPLAYLELYGRFELQRQRLALEREKLQHRCQESARRHELALLREGRQADRAARQALGGRRRSAAAMPSGAERQALAERIAQSPLARLVWGSRGASNLVQERCSESQPPASPVEPQRRPQRRRRRPALAGPRRAHERLAASA